MPLYTLENTSGLQVTVKLDGKVIPHAIRADTDRGYVTHYKTDDQGNIVTRGEHKVIERRDGHVTVTLAPKATAS